MGGVGGGDVLNDVWVLDAIEIDAVLVLTEFSGGFDEVVAGNGERFAITERDGLVGDGIGAVVAARLEFTKVGGRVVVVDEIEFTVIGEMKRLIEIVARIESTAGESVFDNVFGRIVGDLDFGKTSRERGGENVSFGVAGNIGFLG